MIQFLADQIDQLDLALDQLAMKDRNFDRFALMLIDNVVELTLHQYARDCRFEDDLWRNLDQSRSKPTEVSAALGPHFDAKVRLARSRKLVSEDVCDSLQYLHTFRNTAYHQGLRHDGILHSLTLFYFKNAVSVLANFSPRVWSSTSRDKISHRALKYIGMPDVFSGKEAFKVAWTRLREVADAMNDSLVADLHGDMKKTVDDVDRKIQFLADNAPDKKRSRSEVIVESQAWPMAFSEKGKVFASANGNPKLSVGGFVDWIAKNYPWSTRTDPIPSWRKRLASLRKEKDSCSALKKYCQFMDQTEDLRELISESASQLDAHIEHLIDVARGK